MGSSSLYCIIFNLILGPRLWVFFSVWISAAFSRRITGEQIKFVDGPFAICRPWSFPAALVNQHGGGQEVDASISGPPLPPVAMTTAVDGGDRGAEGGVGVGGWELA